MPDESLEGWAPEVGDGLSLEEVIERAFDYRGNVTVFKRDGSRLEGYLFNRGEVGARPVVQMFDHAGDGPYEIPYAEIRTIHFSGKDTAAGNSYAAWLRTRKAPKTVSDA